MNILQPDQSLGVNQELRSPNGAYRLIMQTDGNLVLYNGEPAVANAVWATNTALNERGWPPTMRAIRATMQKADGNFVLYADGNVPVWATGTVGHPDSHLELQDDRNLVIYDANRRPTWATGTNLPVAGGGTDPVTAIKNEEVGFGKKMNTKATLYRDGRLVVESYTENDSWVDGLWGRTFVVVVDAQGRSIWVSQIFEDPTRCSVPDVSCASNGLTTFSQQFPEPVGKYATRIDIYHGDKANFVDLRARVIQVIKAAHDIEQEIQPLVGALV